MQRIQIPNHFRCACYDLWTDHRFLELFENNVLENSSFAGYLEFAEDHYPFPEITGSVIRALVSSLAHEVEQTVSIKCMFDSRKIIPPGVFYITLRELPSLQENLNNCEYMKTLLDLILDEDVSRDMKTTPVYLEARSFKDPLEAYQSLHTLEGNEVLALRIAMAMVRWSEHPEYYGWVPEHLRARLPDLANYAVFAYPQNWPFIPSHMKTQRRAENLLQTFSSSRNFTKLNDAWKVIAKTFPDNLHLHEIAARLGFFDSLALRYQENPAIFKAYVSGSQHNLHTFDYQRLDYELAQLLLSNTRWEICLSLVLENVTFHMDTERRKDLIRIGCRHLPGAYKYLSQKDRELFKTLPLSDQTFGYYVEATSKDCCGALEGERDPITLEPFDLREPIYVHRWKPNNEKPNWSHRRCINEYSLANIISKGHKQWVDPVSKEPWSSSPPSSAEPEDTELSPCEVILNTVRNVK
jgi:hypothetical protein